MSNFYKRGSWNLVCDRCSKKIKADESKLEWTGFIVCNDCYEQRHPQDFVKAKIDKIIVPYIRPPSDTYIVVPYIFYIDENYVTDGYV